MWYPGKAAFRAGYAGGDHWDKENIGYYSIAFGINTKASGNSSTALGSYTNATGDFSTALGSGATASGPHSFAVGNSGIAGDTGSMSFGASHYSLGYYSTAIGLANNAYGRSSLATGFFTNSTGNYSASMGWSTHARAMGSLSIGSFNDNTDAPTGNVAAPGDRVFQIGNGQGDATRSNAITVLRNGHLGIGVVFPTQKLHIGYGGVRLEGPRLPLGDTAVISIGGYGDIQVDSFGSVAGRFVIKENGKVGIGVATPQQKLSVKYGMNIDQVDRNAGRLDSSVLRFGSHSGEAIGSNRTALGDSLYGLDFYTDSKKRMIISNSGRVGIGVSNPSANLEVRRGTGNGGTAVFAGTQHASHFNFSSGEDTYIRAGKDNGSVIINDILGGKVGIGTSSPGFPLNFANALGDKIALWGNTGPHYGLGIQASLLEIHTDIATSDIAFGYGSSGSLTEIMRIKGTGNVGIGVANPQQRLSILGGMNIDQANLSNGSLDNNVLRFGGNSGEAIGSPRTAGSSNQFGLDFYTGYTKRVVITSSGSVGIGINSPQAQLAVSGYTMLGSTSPKIQMKKLIGITSPTDGTGVNVTHGLTMSKILSIDVLVTDLFGNMKPAGYRLSAGYEFYYYITPMHITVTNAPSNSSFITSCFFTILVTYEE
jgi:hypothetical protein